MCTITLQSTLVYCASLRFISNISAGISFGWMLVGWSVRPQEVTVTLRVAALEGFTAKEERCS